MKEREKKRKIGRTGERECGRKRKKREREREFSTVYLQNDKLEKIN